MGSYARSITWRLGRTCATRLLRRRARSDRSPLPENRRSPDALPRRRCRGASDIRRKNCHTRDEDFAQSATNGQRSPAKTAPAECHLALSEARNGGRTVIRATSRGCAVFAEPNCERSICRVQCVRDGVCLELRFRVPSLQSY